MLHRTKTSAQPRSFLTIEESCRDANVSRTTWYELDKIGKAPRTIRIGRKRLVPIEEQARWRIQLLDDSGVLPPAGDEAPAAARLLVALAMDPKTPPEVRRQACVDIMKMAGIGAEVGS
ncbi:MAG: hypothetical protein KIS79_09950 [Burkholderiales bacterium]|nr:hypothetical protein [Burkholderiales bacterium]